MSARLWLQLGALAVAAVGCGAPAPTGQVPVKWTADDTFGAAKAGFFDSLAPLAAGTLGPVRLQAALDHNCPLEETIVWLEHEDDGSGAMTYVIDACGVEVTYRGSAERHARSKVVSSCALDAGERLTEAYGSTSVQAGPRPRSGATTCA